MSRILKQFGGLALVGLTIASGSVHADVSGNFGWTSEYLYRGIPQDDSSAYVGLDVDNNGLYAGTWLADVGQGSEVDLYFGYNGAFSDDWGYGIGATGYFYTDDFDDTYLEINLSVGNDNLSLDASFGQYENFDGPTQDYGFISLQGSHRDFYALIGSFTQDFDGEYLEVGYGTEVAGLDFSISIVHSTADLIGDAETTVIFGIGKTLDVKSLIGKK